MSRANSDVAIYTKTITDLINTLKREMRTLSYTDDFKIMALKTEKIKGLTYIRQQLEFRADIEEIITEAEKQYRGLTVSFISPSRVASLLDKMCQKKPVHAAPQSFFPQPHAPTTHLLNQEEMQCRNAPF